MEHHLTGTRASATEPLTNAGHRERTRTKRPRSAITSGRTMFIGGDPNSAWARRFHDLVVGHVVDAGGRDAISEAQFALCKRAAGLECELEKMEARLSQGEDVDLDRYGRAASHLRRILETVGLERKAKDITRLPLRQRLVLEAEEAA
jgi:hypothetical protein